MSKHAEMVAGYRVVRVLGRGAGSTLYEVKDPKAGKHYTLKRVVRSGPQDDRFVDQLLAEHRITQKVSEPTIRRTHRVVKVRSLLRVREVCLVMEYIDGASLTDHRPETMGELVKVFLATGKALASMAGAGFLHADIKPSNILVTPEGRTRVIDLGQSCPIGTVKQRVQGTPDYIAPEQVKRRALTVQTDMYNLGATMYWCLTGRAIPTLIPKVDEAGNKAPSKERFYPVEHYRPDVPKGLCTLVASCLRSSPGNRPEGWGMVVERLELVLGQLGRVWRALPEESGEMPMVR